MLTLSSYQLGLGASQKAQLANDPLRFGFTTPTTTTTISKLNAKITHVCTLHKPPPWARTDQKLLLITRRNEKKKK